MPAYECRCPKCNNTGIYRTTIARMNVDIPTCCGVKMKREIRTPIFGTVENVNYKCPATGVHLTSKKQRAEVMKRNELVEAAPVEEYRPPKKDRITTDEMKDLVNKAEAIHKGYKTYESFE